MPIPFTTTPLKVSPAGANGVSVSPSGTAWVNGSYVEVESSTSAAWLLAGICVTPPSAAHGLGASFEVDVAVGAVSSETVIGTFHGVLFVTSAPAAVPRGALLCPITIDAIPAGSRVSVRVREASTETSAYGISIHYYEKPIAGSIPYTSQPLKTTASGSGGGTALSDGVGAWVNGSYAQILASTSTDIVIVGVVQLDTTNGVQYEIDLATGGSGSESVIATFRDVCGGITDGEPFVTWLPAPIAVSSGTRLAARRRSSTGGTTGGGILLLYFEAPLGAGVPSSFLSTSVLQVTPTAASAISLSPGAGGTYGSWTEVVASASSDMIVAGVTPMTIGDYDVQLGVGSAGNEVGIGVFKFAGVPASAQTNMVLMPVAVSGRILSGDRVAARLRSDLASSGSIVLNYYSSLDSDNVTATALPAVLPDDGSRAALTPNTSAAWADTDWVQVSAGLPRKSAIYGVVFEQGVACEIEVEVGTGGAGSETTIATVHAYKYNGVGHGVAIFPAVIPVAVGLRIAVRGRRNSTSASAFKVGVLYYDELDVSTIVGGIAMGYRGTVKSSRSMIVSLDGSANTLDEAGKMKVCGKLESTETIVAGGNISGANLSGTNTGDVTLAGTPTYLTIAAQVITRALINLASHVTGRLPFANLTAATAASKLLGRGAGSGAGDFQEVTVGSGLTMSGTTLSASASAPALDDVTDVVLTSPADGDVLTYDSGSGDWVNAAPTGGSGALDDLTDVTITSPSDGDVLTYSSGSPSGWINAAASGGGGGSITQGAYASLPGSPSVGDMYIPTDSVYPFAHCASAGTWTWFLNGKIAVPPGPISNWTGVNTGVDWAASDASGSIEAQITRNGTLAWRILTKTAPSTPYTVTFYWRAQMEHIDSCTAGTYFYDGTKLMGIEFLVQSSSTPGSTIRVIKNTTTTSSGTVAASKSQFNDIMTAGVYTRLSNDGATLNFQWSIDGLTWHSLFSEAVGTFITPTKYAFGGVNVSASNGQMTTISMLSVVEA